MSCPATGVNDEQQDRSSGVAPNGDSSSQALSSDEQFIAVAVLASHATSYDLSQASSMIDANNISIVKPCL
jgi:hypothetical protein